MDGCPLFHRTSDLAHLSGSSVWMRTEAIIDKGPCIGRIVQDFTQRCLGGFAPDQLPGICPSALLAGQENTIITSRGS